MRRLLAIITILILSFSLSSCGDPKPDEAIDKYLKAAQGFDIETMAAAIAPSNKEDVEETKTILEDEEDEYTKYFRDYLKTNAGKMTYKIVGSQVDGDKAVVNVDFRYVDGGPLIKATIAEVFSKMFGLAFTGVEITDEETGQIFITAMEEQSEIIPETYKEVSIPISCILEDGIWYISEIDDELSDVIMSGFITAGKEISDSFGTGEDGDTGTEMESTQDTLFDINNYLIGDLWNDGFCEISHYLESGKGSYGQEIDIDFTKGQLNRAMEKKAGYDSYINGLSTDYEDIKSVWSKLSGQIDRMYEEVSSGAPSLSTDLFTQYRDAFSDLVEEL